VNHALEQVGVAAFRHGREEIAGNEACPPSQAGFRNKPARAFGDIVAIEDDAAQIRMRRQQRGHEPALAAADVDDG
jgi:hypothetical protein